MFLNSLKIPFNGLLFNNWKSCIFAFILIIIWNLQSTNIEIKIKPSPEVKILDDEFLIVSSDFCMKYVSDMCGQKGVSEKGIGFLCPYCLKVFTTHRGLTRDHLPDHKGPVACDSCQVNFILIMLDFNARNNICRQCSLMHQSIEVIKRGVYSSAMCASRPLDSSLDFLIIRNLTFKINFDQIS